MARATLQDAREVTASNVQAARPQAVIVFGEVCRSGNGSDLDLLVLVEDQAAASARLVPVLRPFFRLIAIDPFLMASSLSDDDVTFIDTIHRGRYPGGAGLLPLGEPTEADAHRALAIAETLAK